MTVHPRFIASDDEIDEMFEQLTGSPTHDSFNPDEPRDDHGRWDSVGGPALETWHPPSEWSGVGGQNHNINEPPLPPLRPEQHLSSGVIMRELDGRTWLVKPTNGFGGYNHTFPKGTVEDGLHPQANAIKETYEETGLKARITGYAGDYRGDTSITRMYHAVREGGHPADHGWESERVTLAKPGELKQLLNRSRDRKIARHHIVKDDFSEELHPRDKDGKFTFAGNAMTEGETKFSGELKHIGVPHHVTTEGEVPSGNMFEVPHEHVGSHIENAAHVVGVKITNLGPLNMEGSHHGYVVEPTAATELDMSKLTKTGTAMGSNVGGVYKAPTGEQYYIKTPPTKEHVKNELIAAKLYQLAGVNTMTYVPVKGDAHVATVLQPLEKNNIKHFTPAERAEAQKDFAVHAWLANWDAAGTGGDNQVIVNGKVTTVDTGGSLRYRAQGEPKGAAFGDTVTEINTLRDPSKSPDAAKLYGPMTNEQLIESMKRVTTISDDAIQATVLNNGGDKALVNKLLDRQFDIKQQLSKLTAGAWQSHIAQTVAPAPATAKTPHDYKLHVAGNSAERIKWRDELKKTTDPAARKELQNKIIASFAKHWNSAKTADKKADLFKKIEKYSKLYNIPNPITTAAPSHAAAAVAPAAKAPSVYEKLGFDPVTKEPLKTAATQAELDKAKKNIKLQILYVPGAPPDHPEAQKLIDKFNQKYEGKVLTTNAELQKKVDDFNQLKADMIPLQSEQQKIHAAAAAASAAAQAVQQKTYAEQAAAKAAKEKAELEAKLNDPETKAHYEALKAIGAGLKESPHDVALIAKHKLAISPIQAKYIHAYVGSHYGPVNAQLRKGILTLEQAKYSKALDKALAAMPVYVGSVERGINDNNGEIFKRYESALGGTIVEPQFNSAGVKKKLWGSLTLFIESKTAADIRSFNPSEGGGEVVFRPGTHFHVTKVDKVKKHVWMEEI